MNPTIGLVLAHTLTLLMAAEQAIPQPGTGAVKKEVVLTGVSAALKADAQLSQATGHTNAAVYTTIAASFIDSTVALLNKAGVFGSKSVTSVAVA